MKEKKAQELNIPVTPKLQIIPGTEKQDPVAPIKVEIVERLTNEDHAVLELSKQKRENALLQAKLSLSLNENVELQHNMLIMQLAKKYNLSDGDLIKEDGSIQRKEKV